MNNQQRLQTIITPLVLGIGLTVGVNSSALAYPDNSRIYSDYHRDYHRDSFRDIQPFRSINVTPRYHHPSPSDYYHDDYDDDDYDDDDYDDRYDCDNCRQRRVLRRGIRQPDHGERYRNYDRRDSSDSYIKIKF
jgi:hypothetical protein